MASIGQRLQRSAAAAWDAWNSNGTAYQADITVGMYAGLDNETAQRLARYKALWRYYEGNHKRHLKPRQFGGTQGPDDNITINLSRRVVNKGAAFLFGEPVNLKAADAGTQEKLDAVWRNPEWRMEFFNEVAVNGGVTGDFYMQVVAPKAPVSLPRVINLDPCIVIPTYSMDDIDEVYQYELRWNSGGRLKRTRYVWADDGLTWDVVNEWLFGSRWVTDSQNPPEVWGYSWCPIIHGKNLPNPNSFFGVSDLEDADLNDAINGTVSNLNRVVRLFAHPVIWGKMFTQTDLDVSKVSLSKDENAQLGALELAKDVGGVEGFAKFLSTEFSEVTQVPENDTDRMRIGAQSGFALRVLFHELVQKTNVKRALYGRVIVEASQHLLELAGAGPDAEVKLHWRNPLPLDLTEQVTNDKFELDYGLASRETIAAKRGYDYAEERQRMNGEPAIMPSKAADKVVN